MNSDSDLDEVQKYSFEASTTSTRVRSHDRILSVIMTSKKPGKTSTEKTLQYQDELPPLPLPALEETLEKYIQTCEPLLSVEELEHTRAVCEDFKSGHGPELQRVLEAKAANEKNWIEEWWETFAYLQPRYPSAININWYGVLPGNWSSRCMSQAEAASIFVMSFLNYKKNMEAQNFSVEKLMGRPLCMYQFTRIFNTCIIPDEDCDILRQYDPPSKHIVVLRNNAIWAVDVLDDQGEALPLSDILRYRRQSYHSSRSSFNVHVLL